MKHEAVDELERHLDAARELLRTLSTSHLTAADAVALIARIDVAADQLSGARMVLLDTAVSTAEPGTNVTDQLHATNRVTRRRAHSDVRLAVEITERFEIVAEAWCSGRVSEAQARAIVAGLKRAPAVLGGADHDLRQAEMVAYAAHFDPDDLLKLATRMAELTDPAHAEALEADRLAREARVAQASRSLAVVPDHHGSMLIRGQLPLADGEVLLAQLESLMPSAASYQHTGEIPSRGARRADALVRLCSVAAAAERLPLRGADRPHAVITLDYDTLLTGLGVVGSIASGERLSAADARHLACDANIIPVVLGARSEPLDVGRTSRLFTGSLRAALTLRDQGCSFPGCDAVPAACEAHHITPWWQGGDTSLSNGVLVCAHHHRLIEPDPQKPPDHQWQVELDPGSGLPTFIPPRQIDPGRRRRQHRRHRIRGRTLPSVEHDDPPAWEPPVLQTSAAWVA